MQFPRCLRATGRRPGCHLTTLFGTETVTTVSAIDAPEPKKHGWLPLLSVLFLISYGLMTMLIVEQGRTIESQRALIHELLRDSNELSATKKTQQDLSQSLSAQTLAPETQIPSTQAPLTQHRSTKIPSTQIPSTQIPSTQAPTSQAPSSQAGPQHGAQNQSAKQKPEFRMPSKPEADLVDDVRTLITI
jgi:hypothetical protein